MIRVLVQPEVLRWARERTGKEIDQLVRTFPKYGQWETGDVQPTLRQLEKFANTTHTAVGYFFLPTSPDEPPSIPDFRTMSNASVQSPSLNLLDTIALCRRRQDWYREYAYREGLEPLSFVGSAQLGDDVVATAATIRTAINLDLEERRTLSSWTEALGRLLERVDKLGVLVMVSGTVGSNTQRLLDPAEFRGFSLTDDRAPLIFINGRDTKAAQMFTLVHELAHLWLGQSALSDSRMDMSPSHEIEAWCNRVAAEILVPIAAIRKAHPVEGDLSDTLARLARNFKVSTLVILRRIYDAGNLTHREFHVAYDAEWARLSVHRPGGGGDFYRTHNIRLGNRFTRAMVLSTLEGSTSFPESFQLLGFRKLSTFDEVARRLEIGI